MDRSILIFHKFLMGVTAFFNGRVTVQRSCRLHGGEHVTVQRSCRPHKWESPFCFHNGGCSCRFYRCASLKWLSVVLISTALPMVFSSGAWAVDKSPFPSCSTSQSSTSRKSTSQGAISRRSTSRRPASRSSSSQSLTSKSSTSGDRLLKIQIVLTVRSNAALTQA